MLKLWKIFGAVGAALALFWFTYDMGRDHERTICVQNAINEATENVKIEKQQNLVRDNLPNDDAFLDVLQNGKFGRL